jgi:hypothetical protein
VHCGGTADEFALRLTDRCTAPATTHYVVQSDGRIIAAFAITRLGRLSPGSPPRMLLHEIKVQANARGTNVADDVLAWLRGRLRIGSEAELLLLAPLNQLPGAFGEYGLMPSHQIFKWAVGPIGAPA